ncbi:MAG: hypothetical protein ACYDCO_17450 [Armatimonadota bacterium]
MIHRLLMIIGAAILLVGEPALADFVLRYEARGSSPSAEANDQDYYEDDYAEEDWYDDDPRWDDPYYGRDGYPLYAMPGRVPAPVVLPPIIARPLPPQPMIRIRLRGGGFIWVPNPRIRFWDRPRYPDYATSGYGYIPTPTYPYAPSRRHRRHHRGPWHIDR